MHTAMRTEYGTANICEIGILTVPGSDMGMYVAVNTASVLNIFVAVRNALFATQRDDAVYKFTGTLD